MKDVLDVIEASHSSADVMVTTVYDYGGDDLGNGIRKLAGEMYVAGYGEGVDDTLPVAYDVGYSDGRVEGGLIATVIITGIGAIGLGVYQFMKKRKEKKKLKCNSHNLDKEEEVKDE